jgi:hypothetical protein
MLRYARYAAAAVFALVAVGFVALWIGTYKQFADATVAVGLSNFCIESHRGTLCVIYAKPC